MGDGWKLNVFGKLCIKLFNQLFYCNFNLLFKGNQTKINCFSFPLYSLLLFNRKLNFVDDVWTCTKVSGYILGNMSGLS